MKHRDASKPVTNWYKRLPKHLRRSATHNPGYKEHLINIPFRMLICGPSGSGKTSILIELIHRMTGTFEKMIICCKNKHEPLYQMLEERIPAPYLEFFEEGKLSALPDRPDQQTLIVFDDLCLEKRQLPIAEFFIRGRKLDYSCVYITQNYFSAPKTIRTNVSYIILKKMSSLRDLNMILSDYSLGVSRDTLRDVYRQCTENPLDFLMIDIEAPEAKRFRHNFEPIQIFEEP